MTETDPLAFLDNINKGADNSGVWGKLEGVFDNMGMGNGAAAPAYRAGFGFVVGAGLMHAIRPDVSFNEDGSRRPWIYWPGEGNNPDATSFPWWMPAAFIAAFFGLAV